MLGATSRFEMSGVLLVATAAATVEPMPMGELETSTGTVTDWSIMGAPPPLEVEVDDCGGGPRSGPFVDTTELFGVNPPPPPPPPP
uniref:Putative secreted peptide n=1 Tax=Anopheles braziliensis TaxID=58242 RepID=A0A2M3ZSV8_9DIPT